MLKRSLVLRNLASTLNLPKSKFPPRPDASLRPALIKRCTDDLYAWQAANRPANDTFTLHDGPPYANGSLHIGHALNKILKDVFNRFQLSQGRRIQYTPGWDCHGLPIELKALQGFSIQSGGDESSTDSVAVRRAAGRLAARTIEEQKGDFKSWAVMGDWANAYRTMDPTFELRQLDVFKELVSKGLIFRQYKPVHWSPSTGTALAEAELEYDDHHISTAAYIKFELVQIPEALRHLEHRGKIFALIWTTTPWTLPANAAIAFHSDLEYSVVERASELFIVASTRLQHVAEAGKVALPDCKVVMAGLKGSQLAGSTYTNPLRGQDAAPRPIMHADFVSADSGSGLVHMAPGHGHDDYNACRAMGIPFSAPVDNLGRFTEAALPDEPGKLLGKSVLKEGSQAVLDLMAESNLVWSSYKYEHKYPIDWRTKQPVIIRATAQWFANVDQIKERALEALRDVKFTPESGRARLQSFVHGRGDWCISRQRAWGVPIPALFRLQGSELEPVMTTESVEHIIGVIKERGIDAWWTDTENEPAWIAPSLPEGDYVRGKDTMDVWFDSGSTWTNLPSAFSREAPADVYLEGSDQHRGWFQSSLLTRTAYFASPNEPTAQAPYRRLLTHGFTLDKHGRKMSKSIGNVISPQEIMGGTLLPPLKPRKKQKQTAGKESIQYDAMGPDVLRLWAASSDFTNDVVVGELVLQAVTTSYLKHRNTLKWLLGVLDDYEPSAATPMPELSDRLALLHLSKAMDETRVAYTAFEPHKAAKALDRYVVQDLSSFYFEYAKDVLYTAPSADRARVQAVCYEILQGLLAMLAPVTPLLVEETIHFAGPSLKSLLQQPEHDPFKRTWSPASAPSTLSQTVQLPLAQQAAVVETIRSRLREMQEAMRARGDVKSGVECQVELVSDCRFSLPENLHAFLRSITTRPESAADVSNELSRALVVSEATLRTRSNIDATKSSVSRYIEGQVEIEGSMQAYGLEMVVAPVTDKTKCPRCWRFVVETQAGDANDPSVASEAERERVCTRCKDALQETQPGRL